MCRNIKRLHNVDPPVTGAEVRDAALQFVRKVSGRTRPARANAAAFERAVEEIAAASERLLAALVAGAPPASREALAARARERWGRREST
ncbi:MAG TPA: DUF2277 domain-containing protein [Thermoanaerobaculia bacterium]|nr:DUF2277 domain-containing protein [Thermoanaerobaculia bacterium]